MAANQRPDRVIRFDLFELDTYSFQLRRNGLPVELAPQALRLLTLLTAHPGALVIRKEIKEELWPDESHGDFDSRLNFVVRKLREALRDDAELPRYIQTERRAGYRFIAPVRPVEEMPVTAAAEAVLRSSAVATVPAEIHFGRKAIFAAFVALVSILAIGSFVLQGRRADPSALPHTETATVSMDDSKPEISSVTPILPQARQRIIIRGRGFGLHVAFIKTDSLYLAIRDETADWAAGRLIPQNWDEVTVDVESWTDDQIVINGLSGDYGTNGWKLNEGDKLEIAVWNPQSGAGPARYSTAVVSQKTPRK
jgi:DNA-binding winged helix-turn-helix (wHTH) protein